MNHLRKSVDLDHIHWNSAHNTIRVGIYRYPQFATGSFAVSPVSALQLLSLVGAHVNKPRIRENLLHSVVVVAVLEGKTP